MIRRVILLLLFLAVCGNAYAAPVTMVREYTYQAGDADSKLSCRAIALEQVKRLLLEELGTYIVSQTEVQNSTLTKDEIVTYSAGAVVTVVIEERWNGVEYYMKAKVTADADEVAKSVAALHEDKDKAAELAQLRAQADASLQEIERLKKELAEAKAAGKQDNAVQKEYGRAVAGLTAKDYLEQAIHARKAGNLAEAADDCGKAMAAAPNWSRPYVTRGAAYLLSGDPQSALQDLEQALQLAPSDLTALSLHGVALLKVGRKGEGVAELAKVAAATPKDASVSTNIGGILIKHNLPNEAVSFLTKSINLRPSDQGRAYYLRAQAFNLLGKKDKALSDLRSAAQHGNQKALELLR
jgi:Flp pilus assembly protein TadD